MSRLRRTNDSQKFPQENTEDLNDFLHWLDQTKDNFTKGTAYMGDLKPEVFFTGQIVGGFHFNASE